MHLTLPRSSPTSLEWGPDSRRYCHIQLTHRQTIGAHNFYKGLKGRYLLINGVGGDNRIAIGASLLYGEIESDEYHGGRLC